MTSLKQVKTCLVFVWKISPCCEIGMLFSRIEKIVYDKLRLVKFVRNKGSLIEA